MYRGTYIAYFIEWVYLVCGNEWMKRVAPSLRQLNTTFMALEQYKLYVV